MIKTTVGKIIEGWELLNDAYAAVITAKGSENGWVPSDEISEYEAIEAISTTATDLCGSGADTARAYLEMILDQGFEEASFFEELEAAAARAFAAFAEEMDNEARQQGLLDDSEF